MNVRRPSVAAAQQALEAFERVWTAVSQSGRSQVVNERNDVRRLLRDVIAYLSQESNERRPLKEDGEEEGDDDTADDSPTAEQILARPEMAALRALVEAVKALSQDDREIFFDVLNELFCDSCGFKYTAKEGEREHECPYDEDEEDEDEDDEDEEPQSSRRGRGSHTRSVSTPREKAPQQSENAESQEKKPERDNGNVNE